jgi:ribulose-phosphate 3-epimerase
MSAMAWREWVQGPEIEPSLYAADFLRLGEQITALLGAGARIFHVDVGDGRFIPPVTIGPVVVQAVAPLVHGAGGRIDCHLMVDDPRGQFAQLAAAGADSVTFHVEAVDDPTGAIEDARGHGLAAGVAFSPETPVEKALAASAAAELVLCMSVHPGYSGQAFLPESIGRIERLRDALPASLLVGVDGGIREDNVEAVQRAGADLIVAATAIFGADDITAAYRGLAAAVG